MYRYVSGNATFANKAKSKQVTHFRRRRVVLKISGAALVGDSQNIDPKVQILSIMLIATSLDLFCIDMVHINE